MKPLVAVFDVLGTVLDEHRGFAEAAARVGDPSIGDPGAFAERWLDRLNALVSDVASNATPWRPWESLIDEALGAIAPEVHERHDPALTTVGRRLPPWPDSPPGIDAIRELVPVIALSNAGILPLIDCSRSADIHWDGVLSAEIVRSAKPDARVYRFLLDQLRLEPDRIVMVAAHPWDLRAAAEQGMRTAYVPRPHAGTADEGDEFDWTATDLVDLAAALAA